MPNFSFFNRISQQIRRVKSADEGYVLDDNLEDIERTLNPEFFFRANRQYIVNRKAIKNLKLYFNGKLILNITPKSKEQIIISKTKAPFLKRWIT